MSQPESPRPAAIRASGATKSIRRGDVPEEVLLRYLTDQAKGRTLGFYVDARATRPAFRDRGDRLFADRNDPHAISAMIQIAIHRGWGAVRLTGDETFRREAWRQARAAGLDVAGYAPTPRDREADIRAAAARSVKPQAPVRPMTQARRKAIVEAVVAARVLDAGQAQRMLERIRLRLEAAVKGPRPARARDR